jgi:hypothetical protein
MFWPLTWTRIRSLRIQSRRKDSLFMFIFECLIYWIKTDNFVLSGLCRFGPFFWNFSQLAARFRHSVDTRAGGLSGSPGIK